ncbi:glycosyltransferase family 1 protein [Priestia megaterium]|uniref:glycosyltransferase family 4 protein n=1 Tax=Priestia megaterium TaxID=1404 RepID=UPI002E1F7C00|nr:glycosyltransferase family 1 protein [Priestia megaterium]
MRIALFTDTFAPEVNGAAKTLYQFTQYVKSKQIPIQVFAPEFAHDQSFSTYVHRSPSMPFFLYPNSRFSLPNVLKIKKQLQAFNPSIIHLATPFTMGLCGSYYGKRLGVPLVGSYHTNFNDYLSHYELEKMRVPLQKYMKWFYKPVQKIFAPSEVTKQQLEEQGFHNVAIWARGVNHKLFHPHYDRFDIRIKYNIKKPYILTYVGRLAKEKNADFLMKIARSLPDHIRHQIHWVIVGDGPLKEQMQQQASEHMTFTGFLEGKQLAHIYSSSDLFVFPSETETFGNVVLESLASGTPVVAANAGGVKQMVQHGRNGYLCKPHSLEEFSSAITDLLDDLHQRLHFGHAARQYALTQSWDAIFQHLLSEYEGVVEKSAAGIQWA